MREILKGFPNQADPNLIVGHLGADDAGVYRIGPDQALVLTVDFFTPVVDDPFDYGRVAAANSLSDVYAMGAQPVAALNIAAFPEKVLPAAILAEVLRGGATVAAEAGIVIVGGHTVNDKEIKYGLCVVGMVHPDCIVENRGAGVGDALVLTKAIGTGHLTTALKAGRLDDAFYGDLIRTMTQLNRAGADAMRKHGVHACTDITGNGLLGHAYEMAKASNARLVFEIDAVPLLPGTREAVSEGHLTGGGNVNRLYVEDSVEWQCPVDRSLEHILYDPQTSGGLLIALPAERADALLEDLAPAHPDARVVGHVAESGLVGLTLA